MARNSNDMASFGRVAQVTVDPEANEAYVSDGYFNKRIVVLDADTGEFKRYWGAYGNKPDDSVDLGRYSPDAPPAPQFRGPVHCAKVSNDNHVYVCDRAADRIQVFQRDGTFVKEGFHRAQNSFPGFDVGHRFLEGCRPELHLPGRRPEHGKCTSSSGKRWKS